MDTEVMLALIAAVSAMVATIVSAIVSIKTGKKVDIVHTLTNSNLNRVTTALDVARSEIRGMASIVEELRLERATTAAATTATTDAAKDAARDAIERMEGRIKQSESEAFVDDLTDKAVDVTIAPLKSGKDE